MQEEKLNKKEISSRMRQALLASGLKSKDLAEDINCSVVTISKYLNAVSTPKNTYLTKIAKKLNVSVDWLLTGKSSAEEEDNRQNSSEREQWKYRALTAEKKLADLKKGIQSLGTTVDTLAKILSE